MVGRLGVLLCCACLAGGCGDDDGGFVGEPLETGVREDAVVSQLAGAELTQFCQAVVDYLEGLQEPGAVPLQCWTSAWAHAMSPSPEPCQDVVDACIARGSPLDVTNQCGGLEVQFCDMTVGQFERCAPVASYTTRLSAGLSSQLSCDNIGAFEQILANGSTSVANPMFAPEAMECFGSAGTCLAQFFF